MRQGHNNSFIELGGKFVGVDLGADYCAEHEWGIAGLESFWGIPGCASGIMGIERRKISKVHKNYHTFFDRKEPFLIAPSYATDDLKKLEERYADYSELHLPCDYDRSKARGRPTVKPHALATAWSDNDFAIKTTKDDLDKLKDIDAAIRSLDVALFVGKGHVFQNGGLKLVIVSRVPEDGKKVMLEADQEAKRLLDAAAATGIESVLKQAKKGYYALSPRWLGEKHSSVHPVMFWLNPMEQDRNNFGYFTVEELQLWAENKGPIIKQ